MDTYTLQNDVKTFGFQVNTFPEGVGDAFDKLVKLFPDGEKRSYYGISESAPGGGFRYYAVAEEKVDGEGKKFGYPEITIEKGKYLATILKDWRNNIACIKDIFNDMFHDNRVAKGKPCIEWYKTMDEMLCMVPTDPAKS